MGAGEVGDALHVRHAEGWVRDRLDNDHAGVGAQGRLHRGKVGGVGERGFHAHRGEVFAHEAEGAAIELVAAEDVVAGLERAEEGGADGGHAGAGDGALVVKEVGGAFEPGDLGREDIGVGVAFAGVGITRAAGVLRVERVRIGRGVDDGGLQGCDDRGRGGGGPARTADEGVFRVAHVRPLSIRRQSGGRFVGSQARRRAGGRWRCRQVGGRRGPVRP